MEPLTLYVTSYSDLFLPGPSNKTVHGPALEPVARSRGSSGRKHTSLIQMAKPTTSLSIFFFLARLGAASAHTPRRLIRTPRPLCTLS